MNIIIGKDVILDAAKSLGWREYNYSELIVEFDCFAKYAKVNGADYISSEPQISVSKRVLSAIGVNMDGIEFECVRRLTIEIPKDDVVLVTSSFMIDRDGN